MHPVVLLAFAATATLASIVEASAQAKKTTPAPAAGTRYFTYFNDFMDGDADVILKETRNGATVTAATLDLCYPSPKGSDRRDRVLLDLKVSGASLAGSGASQRDKTPIEFTATQTKTAGKASDFDFKGTVKVGSRSFNLVSTETSDVSEKEFTDNRPGDDDINASPENFVDVSPESLAVRIKIDAVADFVAGLRGKNIAVSKSSLSASCENLRSGNQTLRLSVNPVVAADTLAQLKGQPGVVAAGWSYGLFDMNRTIRFPARDWTSDGLPDAAKIGERLKETLTKTLSAKTATVAWDKGSGKFTLKLKRPEPALGALGLSEELEFTAMPAFERSGKDNLLLWLETPSSTTIDETTGSVLLLTDTSNGEGEDQVVDDNDAVAALAAAFKAQRWDDNTTQFK